MDSCDPRTRLVREKYFCVRPQPLERWLWSQRIPSSAERVFWLHWQEGMQRGDWCSEIPIRRVAHECHIDVSTVTRAYQILTKLGCVRRTDPGRDPTNPFQQATAITEIRLPHELLRDLNRYPNRRPSAGSSDRTPKQGRGPKPTDSPSVSQPDQPTEPKSLGTSQSHPTADPFPGMTGRARLRAISELLDPMTPTERHAYQDALRLHHSHMTFDPNSKLPPDAQSKIIQLLTSLAESASSSAAASASSSAPATASAAASASAPTPAPRGPTATSITGLQTPKPQARRKLSLFELGRLNRQLQTATSPATAPELLRQVVWSVEAGSLRRFDTQHALHIALKKIREGAWTRPNRMPPNWARALSQLPAPEPCGHA